MEKEEIIQLAKDYARDLKKYNNGVFTQEDYFNAIDWFNIYRGKKDTTDSEMITFTGQLQISMQE